MQYDIPNNPTKRSRLPKKNGNYYTFAGLFDGGPRRSICRITALQKKSIQNTAIPEICTYCPFSTAYTKNLHIDILLAFYLDTLRNKVSLIARLDSGVHFGEKKYWGGSIQ